MSLRILKQPVLPNQEGVAILNVLTDLGRNIVQAQDPILVKTRDRLYPWTPNVDDPEMVARHLLLLAVINRGVRIESVNATCRGMFDRNEMNSSAVTTTASPRLIFALISSYVLSDSAPACSVIFQMPS